MSVSKNLDFNEDEVIEITQQDLKDLNKGRKKNYFNINHYFKPTMGVDETNLRLTNVSIYSTTPWKESDFIARSIDNQMRQIKKNAGVVYDRSSVVITDATANIGGNTIGFYLKGFGQVNAVEIDPLTCDILKNNLQVYGYSPDTVYCADYLEIYDQLSQDVVFMDPPWGGPDYKQAKSLDLYLGNTNIIDICKSIMSQDKAKLIALKIPINYNLTGLINSMPKCRNFLTIKIFRYGKYHSYSVVLCY
jgi:predicted RNA methylase